MSDPLIDVPRPLWFCSEDDMSRQDPKLDLGNGNGIWPRTDKAGKPLHDWTTCIRRGMNELNRRLRGKKSTTEPFELGRLDPRSKARLRDAATAFSLHYAYRDANRTMSPELAEEAGYWWRMGGDWLDAESIQLDYDLDRSGEITDDEKNQPFINRLIRG